MIVSRIYIPGLVFFFFVMEGTLFQLLVPNDKGDLVEFVPRFLIVLVILVGIHFGRATSLLYGLVFGLMYDIVYTQLLGVYLFGLGLIGYFLVFPYKRVQDSLLAQLGLIVVAIVFFEYYQYGLFLLIGGTDLAPALFAQSRLLPSVVLNSVFAILLFYPFYRITEHVKKQASLRER